MRGEGQSDDEALHALTVSVRSHADTPVKRPLVMSLRERYPGRATASGNGAIFPEGRSGLHITQIRGGGSNACSSTDDPSCRYNPPLGRVVRQARLPSAHAYASSRGS
jgi:hypothetical protein